MDGPSPPRPKPLPSPSVTHSLSHFRSITPYISPLSPLSKAQRHHSAAAVAAAGLDSLALCRGMPQKWRQQQQNYLQQKKGRGEGG